MTIPISKKARLRKYRQLLKASQVAAALKLHPRVFGSTVVSRADSLGRRFLLAYVSMDPNDQTTYAELDTYLRSHFQGTEVPVTFVRLDGLPPFGSVALRAA